MRRHDERYGDAHSSTSPTEAASLEDLQRICAGRGDAVQCADGARLRTVRAGDGPMVVLVHGFGVSADEWNLVQPVLLDRGRTVLAYDHRGHGRSTIGVDGLTASALWRDFAAVLEAQDVQDAIIVCHSMGNFVGLGALGYQPSLQQRVRAIVCVAPVTGHATRGAPSARLQIPLVRTGLAQYLAAVPRIGRVLARLNLGPQASGDVVEATRRMLTSIPRRVAPLASVLARESIESALPAIRVPINVLTGDADRLTPRWHAELIVERVQHARLTRLPGVAHMVNWEAPSAIVDAVMQIGQ